MNLSEFFSHVPIWVWLLLAFLLRRGFAALYDREMTTGRLSSPGSVSCLGRLRNYD